MGCRVGTTTNGMLLDGGRIRRLLAHGMDVVAFSLAGTGPMNDRMRKGTRIEGVLEAVAALSRAKEEAGARKPAIHIAYMLLRSNWMDVARLPQLLNELGVSDVVISTLGFVLSSALQEETMLSGQPENSRALQETLETVSLEASRFGVRVHHRIGPPGPRRDVCTENVQRAVTVNVDGGVAPCVYTNLDLRDASYQVQAESRPYMKQVFGNLNERPLASIWQSKAYAAFRKTFDKGPLAPPCQDCPKLWTW